MLIVEFRVTWSHVGLQSSYFVSSPLLVSERASFPLVPLLWPCLSRNRCASIVPLPLSSFYSERCFQPRVLYPGSVNCKEEACEPCRKAKQRCDHTVPVCSRCNQRKVTSECRYAPSPIAISTKRSTATGVPSSTAVVPSAETAVGLRQSDGYEIFAAGSTYVQKCPNG